MIEITPLASSSKGNCYKITDGHTALLIECGIRFKSIQQALNFTVSEIAACLVTHEHKDHSFSMVDLMKAGIEVYTSYGTAEALNLSGHRLHIISAKQQFTIGTWRILPLDAVHDAAEPLSFLMSNSDGDKLLFITDSAYSPYTFNGLTHIMLEVNFTEETLERNILEEPDQREREVLIHRKTRILQSHLSLETAVKFFKANDLSKVQEIHLLHLSDSNSDEALIKRTIQQVTGKPVYVAQS